ncbi:MAG: hypothetical protein HY569_00500 [Candidatus Magasanikbacteria bacterium]|nr:hypothetical protein [Candidatus Magasanikbacteria bacterium]
MPRVKLFEHNAKRIVCKRLFFPYNGIAVTPQTDIDSVIKTLAYDKKYVVKVDQGVKKRFKNGLVVLNIGRAEIKTTLDNLKAKGFDYFLIEEFVAHNADEEKYLCLEREREGITASVSATGGVDIENNAGAIKKYLLDDAGCEAVAKQIGLDLKTITKLEQIFDDCYFSFLEINPLVVSNNIPYFLDMAAQVDSAGQFFANHAWNETDIVPNNKKTPQENAVAVLKKNSQASFSLSVINPDGAIFLLLSGGGGSLVVADEVYNLGYADKLANYGEYSGNPNEEETYFYAKQVLSLLKNSKSDKKIIIIGGGVANFTDVRVTFRGIIRALDEEKDALSAQGGSASGGNKSGVKIFVRRGGPGQTEGLAMMKEFLEKNNLCGGVYGPELPLQEIVKLAIK